MVRDRKLRADREIAHGRMLAGGDTERLWGWDTPAGRLRAERRAGLIAAGAGLAAGVRVLEIGCGTGLFTGMFAATGAELTAVDISPELLEKARARKLPPERVRFLEARFEEIPGAGLFDAVVGSSVLHHLEVAESLARIRELLKPGGVMSFAEPNMMNPQIFVERTFRWVRPLMSHISPDETAFVRWPLRRLLAQLGFADIAIVPFDWLHPATPPALIGPVRALGRLFEAAPLVREFAGSLHIVARRPR